MSWIESHQKIKEHPKTLRLASYMDWSINETIGVLHRFWWWCIDYCEDGDLRKYNDIELGAAVGLNKDSAKMFIEKMVLSGFIDKKPFFRVHDWLDYAGRYLESKYRTSNPKKLLKIKQKFMYNINKLKSDLSQSKDIVCEIKQKEIKKFDFEALWAKYPNKENKKSAFRHMFSSIKTPQDYINCNIAIENYLNSYKVKQGYVKMGSTFFNQWQDWLNPTEGMKNGFGKNKYNQAFGRDTSKRCETGNQFKA